MNRFKFAIYKGARFLVNAIYPKTELWGQEKLPDEPCIIVGNHSQMHGPIVSDLYFPEKRKIWCACEMASIKDCPAYAYKDFWSGKPKWIKWFYKLASYAIAPLAACIFSAPHLILVYRSRKITETFRETSKSLEEGNNIIIFPERAEQYNHVLCEFNEGFVDVARIYHAKSGKAVKFVPMYICPALHTMTLGEPIEYNPENHPKDERTRICDHIKSEMTEIAVSLPKHKVVPYMNLPAKEHKYNKG